MTNILSINVLFYGFIGLVLIRFAILIAINQYKIALLSLKKTVVKDLSQIEDPTEKEIIVVEDSESPLGSIPVEVEHNNVVYRLTKAGFYPII